MGLYLNGVEYSIQADWNETGIYSNNIFTSGVRDRLLVNAGRKDISIQVKNQLPYKLRIYDVQGRLCWEPKAINAIGKYTWRPESAGMYIVCLESGKDILTKRFSVVK